ncbi:MAG: tail fiber assembly protein [Providencia sp.]|nr:tail fiber assembly protein [Providencia sp.]
MGEDEDASASIDEEIQRITLVVEDKTAKLDEVTIAFNQIESEYQPLKDEFDTVLPVFFDVREHLNVLKIMSAKEVEAYLNPPISKEQLIVEAEQQKQSLLAEANNAIAPLQYAIDLNMATDEEIAQLTVWKTYCVLLNRVDTSTVPNIEWPEKP